MQNVDRRNDALRATLECEKLEERDVPATASLVAGTLTVTGTPGDDRIRLYTDGATIHVLDGTVQIGAFSSAAVTSIAVNTDGGNNTVIIDRNISQPALITGDSGTNKFVAGGGTTGFTGGAGRNIFFGSPTGDNAFNGDGGVNDFYNVKSTDIVVPSGTTRTLVAIPAGAFLQLPPQNLTATDVETLIRRATAASASTDAIIVVVDRNGRILGAHAESGVDPTLMSNPVTRTFAVDGAYAEALTAAYFANNNAPLTSRTIQFISQSTITQREVDSNPNITDPNSTLRGPGFVAPIGVGGHFPPNIQNTPQVDLFDIEHTNRDQSYAPGPDGIKGTADDIKQRARFNIDPAFVPNGNMLFTPDSYGYQSGILPTAQSRGIGTLPGGIPIYKNGQLVGGIGVFFPGKTGYASEENSSLSSNYDPTKPDRSLEAEWMAFAAVGGTTTAVGNVSTTPIGTIGGIPLPAGFGDPAGRIDLVGIQLDVFGPKGSVLGPQVLLAEGASVGRGNPFEGTDLPVSASFSQVNSPATNVTFSAGTSAPSGWLVLPHDGVGITAAQVTETITAGLIQAAKTRAAIRLPVGTRAQFVYAVTDLNGNIVGLYRQPDATIFSIDVAVAKARNVAYYANPAQLQPIDQLPGVAAGTAITNRTIRYLAEPHFPEGIDAAPPGPFSILNNPGVNKLNGLDTGPPLPASVYDSSVAGYDAFHPGTNFHDPYNLQNQNGIVFFPGSSPLYSNGQLIGGLGVSGDGVDQDDVVTVAAESGFDAPLYLRADHVVYSGVELPYQKFDRNPEG